MGQVVYTKLDLYDLYVMIDVYHSSVDEERMVLCEILAVNLYPDMRDSLEGVGV